MTNDLKIGPGVTDFPVATASGLRFCIRINTDPLRSNLHNLPVYAEIFGSGEAWGRVVDKPPGRKLRGGTYAEILSYLESAALEQSQSELPVGAPGPPLQSSLL